MFVSGSKIVMFDPQACHLPNVNPSNPGKKIDFVQNEDVIKKHPDQFSPLKVFGCDLKHRFQGTLFRFPFREKGRTSKLCNQTYTVDSARGMLADMAEEASSMLIFLKHVQVIGIYEFTPAHGKENPPNELFKANISNMSQSLQVFCLVIVTKMKSDFQE
jgi:sacsin